MTESISTATDAPNELPRGVIEWLEATLEARIQRKERSVSRREGWLIDLDCADGRLLQGFLRLERFANGKLVQPGCQVRRETDVTLALHAHDLPVPTVYARSEALQATLFERVPGRDDVHELEDERQQRAVAGDFMGHLARLHGLGIEDLNLPELSVPASAEEYARAGLDELEQMVVASSPAPDPLARLTFQWLRRNVPAPPSRPALVQGDTGPGNFVYVGDRVSAILDWECAHIGDPMEDLGHLFSRAFFHPWGDTSELVEGYAVNTNRPLDRAKLHYYRVASFAKAALGSTAQVNHFRVAGPLAMMIFFSVAGERGLAQSIVEALGLQPEQAGLPEPENGLSRPLSLPLEEISDHIVDRELIPELSTPYLQDRAVQLRQLARYHARRERYRSAVVAEELAELRALSHRPVDTIEDGLAQLNTRIDEWDVSAIPNIAQYLCRRAQRAEALALPLAGRYAKPVLTPI